jgi:hypothetical protein
MVKPMLGIARNAIWLFCKGRLFQNLHKVVWQAIVGMTMATALFTGLASAGLPLWLTVILAGICAGALQPCLFRDLKFR